MKNLLALLPVIMLFSCGPPGKNETVTADSTTTDSVSTTSSVVTETPAVTNWSTPVSDVSGADSLFNLLARKQIVRGTFGDVDVLTDQFIDPDNLSNSKKLLAVLVHSGEGEGYNTQFATLYTVLAVFEQQADQVALIDFVDLGEGGSYGIQQSTTEGDSVMLAENKFAARVHYLASEEGAGDSGYRKESAEVYVLLSNKLVKVFESDLEDFSFASNEEDYYRETTITTTFQVLPEKTKNLFNLQISTSGSRTELEEGEDAKNENAESMDEDKMRDGIYQWNGKVYEWVKENE